MLKRAVSYQRSGGYAAVGVMYMQSKSTRYAAYNDHGTHTRRIILRILRDVSKCAGLV
ncbi:hypothetical protein BDV26DRAFT_265925 [Aspergillus bertholletiae]|uniref:Uncharacterized protein n=1 Tax=Aspergillus bertholletiae TaxID=1226010 RepID=A0A5N7B2C4_9EURO|nr:hypothetical protein BDV26DRAFT_265925 [Aspergillus bertholletiae]